jgi:hypothetical protein
MKTLILVFIIMFIFCAISISFLVFCTWVLKNKKNTKLYNWIDKNIITETDLDGNS